MRVQACDAEFELRRDREHFVDLCVPDPEGRRRATDIRALVMARAEAGVNAD